jgi:F-type H+-transporting ATPase subunit b
MLEMAEFWVAIAFGVFVLILIYLKVPKLIAKSLDDRAEAIRKELDEARRLREEAQNLLADYQKKHRNVGQEAQSILELARKEAEAFGQETRAGLKDLLERRTQQAEDKIARAEAQAVDEVRGAAIELAVSAAEKILREKAAGAGGASLVDQSIRELKGRLN